LKEADNAKDQLEPANRGQFGYIRIQLNRPSRK